MPLTALNKWQKIFRFRFSRNWKRKKKRYSQAINQTINLIISLINLMHPCLIKQKNFQKNVSFGQ